MLDSVKKYRKGKMDNLDFLDGDTKNKQNKNTSSKSADKRQASAIYFTAYLANDAVY